MTGAGQDLDRWECLASLEGGIVAGLGVAVDADGARCLFAATPVGVFESRDHGRTWGRLGVLADVVFVEPSATFAADGIVYAGSRDGLFTWMPAGARWAHLLSGARVLCLIARPDDDTGGSILLVGTETDGVLLSRDNGRSWVGANPGLLDLTVLALAASPNFARDGIAFAATPTGLYRTRNGASSWRAVEIDEWDDLAVQCLAVSAGFGEDRLVLAGTEERGLLRSDDGGRSWDEAPDLDGRGVTSIVMTDAGVIAATDAGIFRSGDAGLRWRRLGDGIEPILSVAALPASTGDGTGVLVAGLPGDGVLRSDDGGATWAPANDGLIAGIFADLCVVPSGAGGPARLFVADPVAGAQVSRDGGRTWIPTSKNGPPISRLAAWSAADGADVLFGASEVGLLVSADEGRRWRTVLDDASGVAALAAGPSRDGTMVVVALGDGQLMASADGGASWHHVEAPSSPDGVVALAISPDQADVPALYAATAGPCAADGGRRFDVWRSDDGGRRWAPWWQRIGGGTVNLAALPGQSRGVLIGHDGAVFRAMPRSRETRAGIRRPLWGSSTPLGEAASIVQVVVSPEYETDRIVAVATSGGISLSRDGGASFADWGAGLDAPAIVALAWSPSTADHRTMYALGLGGTIWSRRVPPAV